MKKLLLSLLALTIALGTFAINSDPLWDGRYEYIERYVHKRWGANGKCTHCKRRFAIGGEKKKYRVRRQIKDYKNLCDGPWEVLWSYHAAEINHTFVEQTSLQTHTGDSSWTDISGAAISDTFFTTSKKYWVKCKANWSGDNASGNFGIKVLHDSTDFGTSIDQMEPAGTTAYYPYFWFKIWTAVASEGIKMQFKTITNTGDTVGADHITLFAMNLSDDVTENTDWYSVETVADTSLSTTWSTTNNATKTFTPSGNSDWLIETLSRIDGSTTNAQFESRINSSGDVTDTEPKVSQEGEDTTNDYFVFDLPRVFALTNQSNTFTEQSRVDSGSGAGPRKSSSIFILNLEKFKDHADIYTAAEIAITSTSGYGTEVQTLGITPSQTGDVLILSHYIYDAQTTGSLIGQEMYSRQQVDNADQPPGQTADERIITENWDATDELIVADMTVESLDNTLHTIANDAHVNNTSGDKAAEDRSIIAFTMELAAAAPADEIGAQYLNIGHEGIQTLGPGVNR